MDIVEIEFGDLNWETVEYQPTGEAFDYTPRKTFVVEEEAEEISRITGIDGLTVLKCLFCETCIFIALQPRRVDMDFLAKIISSLTGFDMELILQILDEEMIILHKLGIAGDLSW